MDFIPNPLIIPVGLVIGILVAAPVGPVNVICIQRSLQRGFWGGVAAGAGAVLGDGLIALSAALGVGAISGAVKYHRVAIEAVGGLALLAFGIRLYLSAPRLIMNGGEAESPALGAYLWDTAKSFFLTVTNPGAVLGLLRFSVGSGRSWSCPARSTRWCSLRQSRPAVSPGGCFCPQWSGRSSSAWMMLLSVGSTGSRPFFLLGFGVLLLGESVFILLHRIANMS